MTYIVSTMPSVILDTGFETYRLTSDKSEIWQSAPYVHSPLHVFTFIFNVLISFVIELFHLICGKLDRGLKVERLNLPSASRIFNIASDLSLATNFVCKDSHINGENIEANAGIRRSEPNLCSGIHPCLKCKNCRKFSLESTFFQALMKLSNRFHSAKSSGGMHGLLSYPKQRYLLEFPTIENSVVDKLECDGINCIFCMQPSDDEHSLDSALYDNLICRLAYLSDRISSCSVSQRIGQDFINWVDSRFGVSDSMMDGNKYLSATTQL